MTHHSKIIHLATHLAVVVEEEDTNG